MPQQHVVLTTHTTLHLYRCLAGFAAQRRRADSVTLSCDTEAPEIRELVIRASGELGMDVLLVQRKHTGKARCAQVRNNAVRALMRSAIAPERVSRVIFMDADTVPGAHAVALHEQRGDRPDHPARLVSTFRVNLTQEQTVAFDDQKLASGDPPIELLPEQAAELRVRQSRYERQAFWRTVGLGKAHKPRLIGGHFSVPLDAFINVNGVDEAYEGYGQEDDDFTRRLHRAGYRPVVCVRDILVYHLYHPTRAPAAWDTAPGIIRFRQKTPVRCELGLDRPAPQETPQVTLCTRGRAIDQ
jgi:hypothetical protein